MSEREREGERVRRLVNYISESYDKWGFLSPLAIAVQRLLLYDSRSVYEPRLQSAAAWLIRVGAVNDFIDYNLRLMPAVIERNVARAMQR